MLQLSTQSEDRLLGQSQVPFTDTITLKKKARTQFYCHNILLKINFVRNLPTCVYRPY